MAISNSQKQQLNNMCISAQGCNLGDEIQRVGTAVDEGVGSSYTLPAATTTAIGGVKEMTDQVNSTASDVATLVTDFNSLLAKLKAAGLMA